MYMFKFKGLIGFLFASVLLLSCSKSTGYKKKLDVNCRNLEPQKLEVVEFNKVLFGLDTANFEAEYRAILPQFEAFLIEDPSEQEVGYMKDFVTDTFMLKINELVCETFHDIDKVSEEIKGVYQHYRYYYPDFNVPPTFTYVSGIYSNRPHSIDAECALIGLDFYLSNNDLIYDKLGFPRYQSRRLQPAYLTRDIAEELYYYTFGNRINQKTVIDEMVAQGKMLYFIEAMNPALPDSVILGYSTPQMEWAQDNEGAVWAAVVGNNMLYTNNVDNKRMLFNDGPFTAPFGDASAPRLGDYIGLQIVRSFMTNNDETLQNLMKTTDYQDVFQRSQYKPRK
jgi:hypothetical protein